jgi:hypothetical protein
MNVEDRERFWTALDFLAARARSGEQTFEDVRAFALDLHAHVQATVTPSLWHQRCFDEALAMLRWNVELQRQHPGATSGLTLALSLLRLVTAPPEAIGAALRAKADRAGLEKIGAEIGALKPEAA